MDSAPRKSGNFRETCEEVTVGPRGGTGEHATRSRSVRRVPGERLRSVHIGTRKHDMQHTAQAAQFQGTSTGTGADKCKSTGRGRITFSRSQFHEVHAARFSHLLPAVHRPHAYQLPGHKYFHMIPTIHCLSSAHFDLYLRELWYDSLTSPNSWLTSGAVTKSPSEPNTSFFV
jgi:hypothetical protein